MGLARVVLICLLSGSMSVQGLITDKTVNPEASMSVVSNAKKREHL